MQNWSTESSLLNTYDLLKRSPRLQLFHICNMLAWAFGKLGGDFMVIIPFVRGQSTRLTVILAKCWRSVEIYGGIGEMYRSKDLGGYRSFTRLF